jgi:hypothetical protein
MKTKLIVLALALSYSFFAKAQDAQNQRIAFSYISSNFEKAIFEQLDKSKLTGKSLKMYEKSMKRLNTKTIIYFENYLREKLTEQSFEVLPLNTVSTMGNSALNMDGYPLIVFPKKTLKKHADKDLSDYFISATLAISKPIAALVGMKPEISVTLKLFSKNGELIKKVNTLHKTEKKISNMGFAVNTSESFDKMDYEHAEILFEKVESKIQSAIDEAVLELKMQN